MSDNRIKGFCPMGCGETLFVGEDGYVTCSKLKCPRPDAVSELLEDDETEHVVTIGAREFTIKHPMRERLDDALLDCQLHAWMAKLGGPPKPPGRYRATLYSGRWVFVALNTPKRAADTTQREEKDHV